MDDSAPKPSLLSRALRLRCPRCGKGKIFERFYTEHAACPVCGLRFAGRAGNTWAFMYFSTAAFVGPVALAVLILKAYGKGITNPWAIGLIALALVLTMPFRKSTAIAFDYYIDGASKGGEKGPGDPPGAT